MKNPGTELGRRAALLLGVAALSACGTGRAYRSTSAHAAEDGGVHAEANWIHVEDVPRIPGNGPSSTGVGIRITAREKVRVDGVRLATDGSEPCGKAGIPATWAAQSHGFFRVQRLPGDLPPGPQGITAAFPVSAAALAPRGPEALDISLTAAKGPLCLRVPLAANGPDDWREGEPRVMFLGVASRGVFVAEADGTDERAWAPFALRLALPVGKGQAGFEVAAAGRLGVTVAASGELPLLHGGRVGLLGALGYEQHGVVRGGPRVGLRLLRVSPPTGWTGYRDRPVGAGWGLDVYVSRWWSFGTVEGWPDAWVFSIGLSADRLILLPYR